MLQYNTEIVSRQLDFIDNKDLQVIIGERLAELERVFSVNGNLSTIILSISCIEGIFRYLISVFKSLVYNSSQYPKKKNGKTQEHKAYGHLANCTI
jgi:hypothetical protein